MAIDCETGMLRPYSELLKQPLGFYRLPGGDHLDLHRTLRGVWRTGERAEVLRLLSQIFRDARVHVENRIDAALIHAHYVELSAISTDYYKIPRVREKFRRAVAMLEQAMMLTNDPANRVRILNRQSAVVSRFDPDEGLRLAMCALRTYRDRMRYARANKSRSLIRKYSRVIPSHAIVIVLEHRPRSARREQLLESVEKVSTRSDRTHLREIRRMCSADGRTSDA